MMNSRPPVKDGARRTEHVGVLVWRRIAEETSAVARRRHAECWICTESCSTDGRLSPFLHSGKRDGMGEELDGICVRL